MIDIVENDLDDAKLADFWYFWSGSVVIGENDELNINIEKPEVFIKCGKQRVGKTKNDVKEYPVANTCTFTLTLPCYSDKKVFLDRLTEAIQCWEFKPDLELLL